MDVLLTVFTEAVVDSLPFVIPKNLIKCIVIIASVWVNGGGEFTVVRVGENVGVFGCRSVWGNSVGSDVFAFVMTARELDGLPTSLSSE